MLRCHQFYVFFILRLNRSLQFFARFSANTSFFMLIFTFLSGVHFVCNFGRTIYKVSTKVKSIMIPETKTIDRNGNPLIINGILAYQIRNPKRASLDVEYHLLKTSYFSKE